MASDTSDIDLTSIRSRLNDFEQVFRRIRMGGSADDPYRDIHPIMTADGEVLGIRLGKHTPKNKSHTFTLALGTHPNETAAWAGAEAILKDWESGKLPHNLIDINLVIAGPKNRITEFFNAVKSHKNMPLDEYVAYREAVIDGTRYNYNRVDMRTDNPPRRLYEQLQERVAPHTDVILNLHSVSQASDPFMFIVTEPGDIHTEMLLEEYPHFLSPSAEIPGLFFEPTQGFRPHEHCIEGHTQSAHDTLRIALECGGPHWSPALWDDAASMTRQLVNRFIARVQQKQIAAPSPTHELAEPSAGQQETHLPPEAGIYRAPEAIFHPAHIPQTNMGELQHSKLTELADAQGVELANAKADTYHPVRGAHCYKWPVMKEALANYHRAYPTAPRVGNTSLQNLQWIDAGAPIMVGEQSGLVIPAPKSGYTALAPGHSIRPDSPEFVLLLYECPERAKREGRDASSTRWADRAGRNAGDQSQNTGRGR